MTRAVMRPVREEDFDQILALAKQGGGGMTNLPPEPKALRARIDFACACFEKAATEPGGEVYMLALEKGGRILGTSAVFSAVGLDHGFVNYRIHRTVHASTQLGTSIERRVLFPTHDFTGAAEVGSLFLAPEARGGGYGRLLSRARYLFIAQHRELIADPVCAELRGWRGSNGEQPFWEAIGKPFFQMEFEAADIANSLMGNQIINDMMPRHPIYVALLPPAAKEILGVPHEMAMPAYRMLISEGFEYTGYIDVFDGGPLVSAHSRDIKTIRESRTLTVDAIEDERGSDEMIIAAGRRKTFRTVRAPAAIDGDRISVSAETADLLGVARGDEVRAAP